MCIRTQNEKDLQVNPLWGILFDLSFVLQSAAIVICLPARLHIAADSSTQSATRSARLKEGEKEEKNKV